MDSLILFLAAVLVLGVLVAVIVYANRHKRIPKKKLTSKEFFAPFYSRRKNLLRDINNTSVELRHVERRIKNNYEKMLTPEGGMNAELLELLRKRDKLRSMLTDTRKEFARLEIHIHRFQDELKNHAGRDISCN